MTKLTYESLSLPTPTLWGWNPKQKGVGRGFLGAEECLGTKVHVFRLLGGGLFPLCNFLSLIPKYILRQHFPGLVVLHREKQDPVGVCHPTWPLPGAGEPKPGGTRGHFLRAGTALVCHVSYVPSHA